MFGLIFVAGLYLDFVEEIRFMINPEVIIGILFLLCMDANEAIEIVGMERFSNYTGSNESCFCFYLLETRLQMREIHFVGFLSKLLETKILQVLRFKHGQIYSVGISVFLGGNKPSRTGDVRGYISVNLSCDPDISLKLVDLVLEEILRLKDVLTILEIE
ncbi:hypothetical protein C5167_046191 [Papaver somniferum]|uniref:Uncharacterized protein n=1 Tax=Papaver somniferum TaxID=3469 RepID=A0A4Y7LGX3_PAPSO|nr:hypothetical protein C5167_046191 [Papaver somniferum]